MRQQFKEDEKTYRHKLQAYQDGQQRQAQLVQKMQNKVGGGTLGRFLEQEIDEVSSGDPQEDSGGWNSGLLYRSPLRINGFIL